MNTIIRKAGIAGGIAFIIAVSFFAGLYVDANKVAIATKVFPSLQNNKTSKTIDMTLFWRAWDVLNEKYISSATSTSDTDKIYGAIRGLTDSYEDPYTVFMTPEETKEFQSDLSGTLEGIGAVIDVKDNILTISSIISNSPAEKAGLKGGDRILKIEDKATEGMTASDAVKLIRGKKGTPVNLEIQNAGTTNIKTVKIIRDIITTPIVETTKYSNNTFGIKVTSFTSNSAELFRDALKEFNNSGYTNLIVDLRNNTGGYLDAAVDIASWFLPAGQTIVTEDFGKKKEPVIYKSKGYNLFDKDKKIVILVNENSASASEIFAGALKDYDKAVLVGSKTFGKGSVQELVQLSKDTVLKVTIARWLTPKGTSISHNGIEPDYPVEMTIEDYKNEVDPQLDKALEVIKKINKK